MSGDLIKSASLKNKAYDFKIENLFAQFDELENVYIIKSHKKH